MLQNESTQKEMIHFAFIFASRAHFDALFKCFASLCERVSHYRSLAVMTKTHYSHFRHHRQTGQTT